MKKYNATIYDKLQAKALLTEGYQYLARDKNNTLSAYDKKPFKHTITDLETPSVWASYEGRITDIETFRFKFIKWEDEKPTLITDIIHKNKKYY